MKISVVIRTHNEEKTIGELFEKLKSQTFHDFETVLVDNASTDKTLEIARKYKIDKLINIPKGKFSHSKSLNDAIRIVSGDLIVILNGHSIPIDNNWLEKGLKNFKDSKVAAISGDYIYADTPILNPVKRIRMSNANLSNTNSIIRKYLWEKYHFDEDLSGVEDYDWGLEMQSRGFKIIKDPGFMVRHYHRITPETRKYWAEMIEVISAKNRKKSLMQKTIFRLKRVTYKYL